MTWPDVEIHCADCGSSFVPGTGTIVHAACAQAKLAKAKAALKFYTETENWLDAATGKTIKRSKHDGGERARACLKELGE